MEVGHPGVVVFAQSKRTPQSGGFQREEGELSAAQSGLGAPKGADGSFALAEGPESVGGIQLDAGCGPGQEGGRTLECRDGQISGGTGIAGDVEAGEQGQSLAVGIVEAPLVELEVYGQDLSGTLEVAQKRPGPCERELGAQLLSRALQSAGFQQ